MFKEVIECQMAKLVAWHRYHTRFWKQSALFCDRLDRNEEEHDVTDYKRNPE